MCSSKWFQLTSLVLLQALMGSAAIIRGTTVGPGFKRPMGRLASRCPVRHPYAFDHGTKCCGLYRAPGGSSDLQFEDPVEFCPNGEWRPCPDTDFVCVSCKVPTVLCPPESPIHLSGICCGAPRELFDPDGHEGCLGQVITEETPQECCPAEFQHIITACAELQKKCKSSGVMVSPETTLVTATNTFRDDFRGDLVLVDGRADLRNPYNYWITTNDMGGSLEFDLGYHQFVRGVRLRNSNNEGRDDRATKGFTIQLSNTTNPYNWQQILSSTLDSPFGLGGNVPLTSKTFTPVWARFAKFEAVLSYYAKSAALQFIEFY